MKNRTKYVAIDGHSASCVFCARRRSASYKVVFERTVPTEIEAIRATMFELGPDCVVTFEEGEMSNWLYHVLKGLAAKIVVCNPRENRSGSSMPKSDKIDAGNLSLWLAKGLLEKPVYKEQHGTERLWNLVRSYTTMVADCTRAKNRYKSLLRSQAIRTKGQQVYGKARREQLLASLGEHGARERAERLLAQIDAMTTLVRMAKRDMTAELAKHPATKCLLTIPGYGPVRTAQVIVAIKTPWRFRRDRQLWSYGGLQVVRRGSGEVEYRNGVACKRVRATRTYGLNRNHNHQLKEAFKGAAATAIRNGSLAPIYAALVARGLKPEIALVSVARKIATLTLTLWKRGECFDVTKLNKKTA